MHLSAFSQNRKAPHQLAIPIEILFYYKFARLIRLFACFVASVARNVSVDFHSCSDNDHADHARLGLNHGFFYFGAMDEWFGMYIGTILIE